MSLVSLPDNYEMAKKRLCNLEKRLAKCPKTAEEYNSIILGKGYITRVQPSSDCEEVVSASFSSYKTGSVIYQGMNCI